MALCLCAPGKDSSLSLVVLASLVRGIRVDQVQTLCQRLFSTRMGLLRLFVHSRSCRSGKRGNPGCPRTGSWLLSAQAHGQTGALQCSTLGDSCRNRTSGGSPRRTRSLLPVLLATIRIDISENNRLSPQVWSPRYRSASSLLLSERAEGGVAFSSAFMEVCHAGSEQEARKTTTIPHAETKPDTTTLLRKALRRHDSMGSSSGRAFAKEDRPGLPAILLSASKREDERHDKCANDSCCAIGGT